MVNQYHELPVEGWEYEHAVVDTFIVSEADHYHQIDANLRISADYEYANLNLKIEVSHPDSTLTVHKLPIELAEKSGKWKGSGLGDIITYQVPILHRKFLNKEGKYTFKTYQDMRVNPVPHVLSAGIRVQQQEEIF